MLPMALFGSSSCGDTLFTSGFLDDVAFSYHEANGPESSMTLCLGVCQVTVPVGWQTTSVWLSSSECGTGAKSAIYD